MITRDELREYAKIRRLNLGQAEKDYFQNVILFILYLHYGKSLVFKGGTALNKCYGSRRFSEDLDFTSLESFDLGILKRGLKRFRIQFEVESQEYEVGLKIDLKLKGPLYMGARYSLCKLIIDISYREKVILQPIVKTIGRFLEEIPEFDIFVMQEREILAEKVRAILTRARARDIYDLWFLLQRNVPLDLTLVNEKLKYYNLTWDREKLLTAIKRTSSQWETELKATVKPLPKFDTVFIQIENALKMFDT